MFRIEGRCDQRCLFCSADPTLEPLIADPAALAERMKSADLGLEPLVVLSGGEPLLSPHLVAQIEALLAAGAGRIMIQTNGMRLARPKLLEELRPFRARVFFLVSLHSHRADVSDLLTRRPGGHERTSHGVSAATSAGFRVWLNHVLTSINVAEAEDFVAHVLARWPRVALLVFSTVNPTYRAARHPWLMPRLGAVGPPLRRALATARQAGLATAVSDVCGVPLCVVPGFEDAHDTYARAPEPGRTLPDDRVLAPFCSSCRFHARCLGVWRGYAARYGFVGLTPL